MLKVTGTARTFLFSAPTVSGLLREISKFMKDTSNPEWYDIDSLLEDMYVTFNSFMQEYTAVIYLEAVED